MTEGRENRGREGREEEEEERGGNGKGSGMRGSQDGKGPALAIDGPAENYQQ